MSRSQRIIFSLVLLAILISCLGLLMAVEIQPSIGAQAANHLRDLAGPRPVAILEEMVFWVQDAVKQQLYQWGVDQADAPWESSGDPVALMTNKQTGVEGAALTTTITRGIETPASMEQPKLTPAQTPYPTTMPAPTVWQLPTLIPFGEMEGEGVWTPYLYDQQGNAAAMRTFLQPDPERPYAIVAVVAFDLSRTRLHYVLGFNEPSVPGGPKGEGLIPEKDREAGVLLAAFNGGFRAVNGYYGAMANGITALPPKNEMATIGIYRSGEVQIGSWGDEINEIGDLEAWRQNCRLIIDNGAISQRVYNDSIVDWGGTISNQIVTRRSGIGLDQEAETLYYFAGPSLSMSALADAMLAAGVQNGMLLDINHYPVHFTAIQSVDGELVAEPLLPKDMIDKIERYLGPSPVDFFYVTLVDNQLP